MNFKQSFRMAVRSLLASKMRSFLTMLGIVIGVGAVIIIVSIVGGVTKDITEQFESMGTNLISVNVMGRNTARSVSVDEMESLVRENPDFFASYSPNVNVNNATIKYGNDNLSSSCIGVNEYYGDIANYPVANGRFLSYMDVEGRKKVCILGTYIVNELFGGADPIGEQIKINSEVFTIIGVLEEKQDSGEGGSDDTLIIPYTTAMRLSGTGKVSAYVFSAANTDNIDEAVALITDKLYEIFKSEDYYYVFSQNQILQQLDSILGTMTLALSGIAGVSLLVGGIGIMNIMLVSVTERTKEIGIRKSLGARRRDILGQFLIEAGTSSSIGGVIGIIFGIGAAYAAGALFDMTIAPSVASIIIAFTVSVAVGIIFGYFPAKKAAKLRPIEALRYE